jgi:hypothetical protein
MYVRSASHETVTRLPTVLELTPNSTKRDSAARLSQAGPTQYQGTALVKVYRYGIFRLITA